MHTLVHDLREDLDSVDPFDRPVAIAWLPEEIQAYRAHIHRASAAHGVEAELIAIIILVESRGRRDARSPVGARGLMQVMPRTARDIARRRGLEPHGADALFDPATNIDYGSWYLAQQLRRFLRNSRERNIELAAAAYNGGPRRVRRHVERGTALPPETRRYTRTVLGLWREREDERSETLARLWPAKA